MYCGGNIVVHDAIQLASGVNIGNFIELAKAAAAAQNPKEAYDYYTKALEYDPTNATAWLGKGEAAGWMSKLTDIKLTEMTAGLDNAIKYTKDSEKQAVRIQCAQAINRVVIVIASMARKHVDQFVQLDNSWQNYLNQCTLMRSALEVAHSYDPQNKLIIQGIINFCTDNIAGISFSGFDGSSRAVFLSDAYEALLRSKLKVYTAKMQALDSRFVQPTVQRANPGGCFVATATMGDVRHPAVVELTRFRDEWLLQRRTGRICVRAYYSVGPYLAIAIYKSRLLRRLSYLLLVRPAARLSAYLLQKNQR
jgi:tetratricopeptide (TPR) repeat protein